MTAKDYLAQAKTVDMRIRSKLQQIESLNALASSCSDVFHNMTGSRPSEEADSESSLQKIVEMEEDLKQDVNGLIELKKEIMDTVGNVPDAELQTLLEKRYLCFLSWDTIANEMNYSVQHIYRMHERALARVSEIMTGNKGKEGMDLL